jgi:putative protease
MLKFNFFDKKGRKSAFFAENFLIFDMKPELLSPAGSPAALEAAVAAGADAVYFGAQSFNARKNASNFNDEELKNAVSLCRLYGVKTNIVLNTQLYGAELAPAILLAEQLLSYGADAFIVADIGLARELLRLFPGIHLHASTQCTGQNVLSARALAEIGFERMVAPRELSLNDIQKLCKDSPIETEIFVHGALCVSHSGQCLMSSMIGGRSGNRGECAQPCRLPYKSKNPYALSLKDLCLAAYVPELMDAGVASFKIEGRMKTPDYVYGVISAYRKLIDEHRGATPEEIRAMAALFSRSGFTDGYYHSNISKNMLGIRTDADKQTTASVAGTGKNTKYPLPKMPLDMSAEFRVNEPAVLRGTVTRGGENISAEAKGDVCISVQKTATSEERLKENLGKLGSTPFVLNSISVEADEINIPISSVNALRRDLCEKLSEKLLNNVQIYPRFDGKLPRRTGSVYSKEKSAYFCFADALTEKALGYFDRIFLPLTEYVAHAERLCAHKNVGVAFPPVAFDHELATVRALAEGAYENGARMALVPGFWQAEMAGEIGFEKHGDFRLNIYNSESASVYAERGFASVIVSPEIGASAASGLSVSIPKGYIAYGRLPLMTMEKCVIRDSFSDKDDRASCRYCDTHKVSGITDRTGARFPVIREFPHRNVILNSVPTYMIDKPINGLFAHAIFTDESKKTVDEIIDGMQNRLPAKTKFRRL